MTDVHPQVKFLATKCVERCEALGYKGKKADTMALDFFVGAAIGAEAAGDLEIAALYGRIAAWIISVRGMIEVRKMAQ